MGWTDIAGGLAQYAGGALSTKAANDDAQKAYAEVLRNLKARFADYDKLGPAGYQNINAQELGPSALGGIPEDAQARGSQQEAIAALDDVAKRGGLSLADMKALNDIQANLSRNNSARSQGIANQYAARGQLGSGNQMAMDLAGQQNAATNANAAGESAAAQAQARAIQAVLQKANAARAMGNDDYQRKANAARAADAIAAHNASARTDAGKYNNSLAGQNRADELNKLRGETDLTNSMNSAVLGSGFQNANTKLAQGALGNSFISGLTQSARGIGNGKTSPDGSGMDPNELNQWPGETSSPPMVSSGGGDSGGPGNDLKTGDDGATYDWSEFD